MFYNGETIDQIEQLFIVFFALHHVFLRGFSK